jgi:hypothetical protein
MVFFFLVIPVDKDMSGVPPYGKGMIIMVLEERRGETDFEEASCTQREHSQDFERRGECG